MGWFWADPPRPSPRAGTSSALASGTTSTPPAGCPKDKGSASARPSPSPQRESPQPSEGCPVRGSSSSFSSSSPLLSSSTSSTASRLNPLNYMPSSISQSRAAGQKIRLPIDREMSSIPKGDGESERGNWEYPSPQQMYNAMLRKGYDDTPEDAVESMVSVHNFLNEGAWGEIVEWERRFSRGLAHGWNACSAGEAAFAATRWRDRAGVPSPRLVRFMGRPEDMTPKARLFQGLGWAFPSKFKTEPPFDRHDWIVQRTTGDGRKKEVRYVIDYYEGPPEPTGEPVFYLDVRPAVDGPTAAAERMMRWGGDVWYRASGAAARS